ncbi:MAG: MOSC domain-containing protein [Candidatus Eremiobacteraeota bacterium]|nr:MOSC domain-containing protein [Candidatus Eremiobacteraeota bacterium]
MNVGRPRVVQSEGEPVDTGIFKHPVKGRPFVRRLNIVGDEQADLRNHGGTDKAVYAYPHEYYEYWRGQYPGLNLPFGAFGENLTVEGLLDIDVRIGDRLGIGSAQLRVTQPRIPCYKLGIRLGRPDIVRRFVRSEYCGFYLAVECEGEIGAGDAVSIVASDAGAATVTQAFRTHLGRRDGPT